MSSQMTPLGAAARGIVAGVAGTAAMTAWQEVVNRFKPARGASDAAAPEMQDPWEEAPAPAKVARRVIEGVFQREVRPEQIQLLTHVTHWTYGTAWGAIYGLIAGTIGASTLKAGAAFGSGVWAMSYVQLVPMGLYEPPWKYPIKTLAEDLSYHLVYGAGVAAAFHLLIERRSSAVPRRLKQTKAGRSILGYSR